MNIEEIRGQYPQYSDMSDLQLADALHGKYYSDLPKEEFYSKIGYDKNLQQNTEKNDVSAWEAFNNSAQDMASMGLYPAASALGSMAADSVASLWDDTRKTKSFDEYANDARNTLESGSKQHPIASGAGSVFGFLGGAKPAEAGLDMVKQGYRSLAKEGAKLGAPIGVAHGLSAPLEEGEDWKDRLENAGKYGAAYAAGSAGLPVLLKAGGAGYSSARDLLSRFYSPAKTSEEIASTKLANALSRDNVDVANIPVSKNLLQAGGRSTSSAAESIATRENPASDKLFSYADERGYGLPDELSSYLGKQFKDGDFPAILEGIKKTAKEKAAPAYKEAYNVADSIADPQIEEMLNRVVSSGDWPVLTREAQKIAAYEGQKLGNLGADGLIKSYSTKDLDYMTRALRNLGQATEGMGAMGGMTPIGAMRKNAASTIRNRLGELNPSFKKAVTQYADDIAVYDAAQAGKKANIFSKNWKDAVSEYKKLPNKETQAAWRVGLAETLQNMINRNPTSALRQFNSPQFKKAMESFYTPEELNSLSTNLMGRLNEQKTLQRITGNSRTAARAMQQADDAALSSGGMADVAQDLIQTGAKRTFINRAANAVSNKFSNNPKMQKADKLLVEELLSSPFARAGNEVSGKMHPEFARVFSGKTPEEISAMMNMAKLMEMYNQPMSIGALKGAAAN